MGSRSPVLPVVRRIHLQGDQGDGLSQVDRVHARRELLGMGQGVLDGTPLHHLGPERPPHHRPGRPGLAVEGLGVGGDVLIHEAIGQAVGFHARPSHSGPTCPGPGRRAGVRISFSAEG